MADVDPIDIRAQMESFFGVLELCHQAGIGGLMADGLSREEAEREWASRQKEDFRRRERPPFSRHFPEAGLWRGA
ncbi:MAG TPA: hypothetical protein VEN81_08385 [Planctomycetota bacterium]|nr:hypothetical protein [Planctomycetota bacterium]